MAQKPEDTKSSFADREKETLAFWQKNKIFEKSLEKDSPQGEFVFYDGPPFANGLPHYGHIVANVIKDVIPRYKTMQGYHVARRWGWDCHGLPVENLIEKELGLKTKKDIEEMGIAKFNEAARASVLRYTDEWRKFIPRIGRWVDMEDDYRTMDTSYTESVWWAFKTLHEKGLVYQGFKAMHLCPHCETTLSNFEVTQGYKDATDISVYVKFPLADEAGVSLLAWTTTPWTLPGNAALAVKTDTTYVKVSIGAEKYILAKERLAFLKDAYTVVEEFSGSKLVGLKYKPPFSYYTENPALANRENGWKVYGADFVTTTDGTGIVHIAPAFGEDDLRLSEEKKLPFIQHVGTNGKFKAEVTDFADRSVKPKDDPQSGDVEIIKNLAAKGLLFAKEKIKHPYPFCWRCDTPLLNYASTSWFVRVTELRHLLVAENKKVEWVPQEIGEGRFGKWLEGARDWAISRSRYWGAPLPVWKCSTCEKQKIVGSINDLVADAVPENTYFVMRHGESESNTLGVMSSHADNPHHLTESGRKAVEASAAKLKAEGIDMVIASDFIRTKETAEIVAEATGLGKGAVILDPRLREWNAGDFNLKPVDQFRGYFKSTEERFTKMPPNGETLTDIRKRLSDLVTSLEATHIGKKILIVTHETPTWMLMSVAAGEDIQASIKRRGETDDFISLAGVRKLEYKAVPRNSEGEIDLHRPYIDAVTVPCECGGVMKRVPEVFDCWFESGSMPYAEAHYMGEGTEVFDPHSGFFKKAKGFPADFIAEGLDQTRGWFYSLIVLSVALFGHSPYKRVIVNGTILAEDGEKMSKRLKNYPDPNLIIEKYGADALRYYFLSSPAMRGQDVNFSEKILDEVAKKVLSRLDNVLAFYELYAGSTAEPQDANIYLRSPNVLDQWILARQNELIESVTSALEANELDRATRPIGEFVDDLSTWYIRRSRERFKEVDAEGSRDKHWALATTRAVLLELSRIIAPFLPFTAEYLYQKMKESRGALSVHLESWPHREFGAREHDENKKTLADMAEVRRIVSLGLEARAKVGIKVRQPLSKLTVKSLALSSKPDYATLIADELNVKEVVYDGTLAEDVRLDTALSAELLEEGRVRELIRFLQDIRKQSGLKAGESALLRYSSTDAGKAFVEKNKVAITKGVSLSGIEVEALTESEAGVTAYAAEGSTYLFRITR